MVESLEKRGPAYRLGGSGIANRKQARRETETLEQREARLETTEKGDLHVKLHVHVVIMVVQIVSLPPCTIFCLPI